MPDNPLEIIRLTPCGCGAVASLLLTGSGAAGVFLRHWQRKTPSAPEILAPETPPTEILPYNKPVFGKIRLNGTLNSSNLNNNGQTGVSEEAVVHFITPDEIEIHCHGGTAVAESVENVFLAEGAVKTGWIEHFCRSKNQGGESQRDAAFRMLPFAETERTAQILLAQMSGALERELKEIDELPDGTEKQRRSERLRNKEILGRHLIKPFSVVLAGEVNAGKSSLLNAILGYQRVITDAAPGTTRDTVSAKTAINGFLFEFSDTAGFRSNGHSQNKANQDKAAQNELLISPIEQEGIKRSEKMLDKCDLIVWVMDITAESSVEYPPPEALRPAVFSKILFCHNKIDLIPGMESANLPDTAVPVSAASGEGIDSLLQAVFKRLIPSVPEADEGIPLPVISAEISVDN